MPRTATVILILMGIWGALLYVLLAINFIVGEADAESRAIILMLGGLLLLWVLAGGLLMRWQREAITHWWGGLPLPWQMRFVLLATLLALIEEAVTTSMTNLGPTFGSDTAMITASRHYLEVVCLHSVVVFIPMFMAWAWLLGRYNFRAVEVMLLFGINGLIGESISFGGGQLLGAGLWVYIYGLMVYLPAYALPEREGLRRVGLLQWGMALVLPLLATVPAVPFILAAQSLAG